MISINATLIFQVINFLILMWILNRLLYRPILKIIEEREQTLENTKLEMNRLKEAATEKAESIEAQLQEARSVASAERDEARHKARTEADAAINKAIHQAEEHIDSVRQKAHQQAVEAREELNNYKTALTEMVLLKVMGRKVS